MMNVRDWNAKSDRAKGRSRLKHAFATIGLLALATPSLAQVPASLTYIKCHISFTDVDGIFREQDDYWALGQTTAYRWQGGDELLSPCDTRAGYRPEGMTCDLHVSKDGISRIKIKESFSMRLYINRIDGKYVEETAGRDRVYTTYTGNCIRVPDPRTSPRAF